MKIMQVVHGFPPERREGTELYTYGLSKELGRNHEVHVFYPRWQSPSEYDHGLHIVEHAAKLGKNRLYFSTLNLLSLKHTYKNSKIEREFAVILDEINPDIVHFQHLINLSVSLIELVKAKKVPAVLTLHDFWFICPRISLLKSDYSNCDGPDPESANCCICWNKGQAKLAAEYLTKYSMPRRFSKLFELGLIATNRRDAFKQRREYMKSLLLRVDKLIAPSKFLRNVFVQYGIPEDRIVDSSHGYDLSVFEGFKKRGNGKLVFGFAGKVDRHKGVHVLVEAFNKVENENVELRIYGNYDAHSDYYRELQAGISNRNIKFMGRFVDVRVPYSEVDILVVPSICYESFSLVIREAFITKTPVIVSDIGALPESVQHNKTGLLFRAGDSNDLYENIKTFIENPGLIGELQANIGPVKTIADQVGELEIIYRAILEKKCTLNSTLE